ncbi:MAG: tRNA (guanosine(46)-N7)-methyltransferase TrmB [Bacteroidota bacterium]
MSKNKRAKFSELSKLDRVFQPAFDDVFQKDHPLKGKWSQEVFHNNHPIVLELGCGKGEYTLGLARKYKDKNFIGIDIKGARIWKGAKTMNEEQIRNAAFLRTRIELIRSFFSRDEVSEVWLTFPDPQEKKRRKKKRLTGPRFLNEYRHFLKDNGIIHLKTDNDILYDYTLKLVTYNQLDPLFTTSNLYGSGIKDDILEIKTYYEKQYLAEGKSINYIKFRLPKEKEIIEFS